MALKQSNKLRKLFLGFLTTAVLSGAVCGDTYKRAEVPQKKESKDNIFKAFEEGRAKSFSEYLEISEDFDYDTLIINKETGRRRNCLARYIPSKDKIEFKHYVFDYTGASSEDSAFIRFFEKFSLEKHVSRLKVHELCHLTFHRYGQIKSRPYRKEIDTLSVNPKVPYKDPHCAPNGIAQVGLLSLSDLARIGQYNEIGAETGSRIYERERYLKSKNINEFYSKDDYVKALENGEIDPFDTSPEARQKEYALLVNAMFDRWIAEDKPKNAYISLREVRYYIGEAKKFGFLLPEESDKKEMDRRVSTCLTFPIDGKLVDFSVYIKDKVVTPQPIVQKVINKYETTHRLYKRQDFNKMLTFNWQKNKGR